MYQYYQLVIWRMRARRKLWLKDLETSVVQPALELDKQDLAIGRLYVSTNPIFWVPSPLGQRERMATIRKRAGSGFLLEEIEAALKQRPKRARKYTQTRWLGEAMDPKVDPIVTSSESEDVDRMRASRKACVRDHDQSRSPGLRQLVRTHLLG